MPRAKKIIDESITPDGIIKSAMRLLFMRSREKGAAMRRDKNTCQQCGAKGSVAKGKEVKTECHHIIGTEGRDINWQRIYEVIREELLCPPQEMITFCRPCHLAIHGKTIKPKRS
jgi:5-methylcytosine-specific restriction endonuclease McrA